MKTIRALALLLAIGSLCNRATAQSDSSVVAGHALLYADSLVRCAFFENWNNYLELSLPSAIKYYGGKDGFQDHVNTMYYHKDITWDEKPEKTRLITLMNDGDRWQTVIEKIRSTFVDQRKAKLYSYLIGQSYDDGLTWKYVDVGFNTNQNLIYIVPDIFGMLPVPQGKTVFEDEVVAEQQPAPAAQKHAAKKPRK